MKTFDIVLLYYDRPDILKNWFYRLVYHSDYSKFESRSNIIIADSGTPLENLDNNYQVIREQPQWVQKRVIYARAETTEIRKKVPEGVSDRPQSHAYNMAAMDISNADVIISSVIGLVFSPAYFSGHIAAHLMNERALVLPKRYDLDCLDYHQNWFDKNWNEIKKFRFIPSGGWPDFSLRRKWWLEIGGWDEYYTFISPADMDFASRLSGKLDNGSPSEWLFPGQPSFENFGLDFVQTERDNFVSLTCNTYSGHRPSNDTKRLKGHEIGNKHYLANWGIIKRNLPARQSLQYSIRNFK